jgi:Uma2 family endonuclease
MAERTRLWSLIPQTARVAASTASAAPDALVCPRPHPDALVIDNPLVVVEVRSAATAGVDHGVKPEGYFSLESLKHYLILDPDRPVVIHHKRGEGDVILTRILHEGALQLEPPGLDVQVADLFGPPEATP